MTAKRINNLISKRRFIKIIETIITSVIFMRTQ